jgi:hypothetical protein
MFQGDLDPTMPIERIGGMIRRFNGTGQTFIRVPFGKHVAITERTFEERERNERTPTESCVQGLYLSFLAAPGDPLDTSCIGALPSIDFVGDAATSRILFGMSDTWGDRIPTGDWLVYVLLYRLSPLVVALSVPALAIASLRAGPVTSVKGLVLRGVVAAMAWVVVSVVVWKGLELLPFILEFRSLAGVGAAVVVVTIQFILGLWWGRWVTRSQHSPLPANAGA